MTSARKLTKKGEQVMHEWKKGSLHSGSKTGPQVVDQKQALAIAFDQDGRGRWPRKK